PSVDPGPIQSSGSMAVTSAGIRATRVPRRVRARRTPGSRTCSRRVVKVQGLGCPGPETRLPQLGAHRPVCASTQESLAQELPRQCIDVALVPGSPTADRHDQDRGLSPFHAIDDAVALTDRADTTESGELADERLSLLLGRRRELIGA